MDIDVIAENLTELLTNTVNMTSVFYDVFLNPNPMDVELQQYNNDNELVTVVIPNRAKDRRIALDGEGSPEGVKEAPIGTAYVDLLTDHVYFKTSGDDSYGWTLVLDQRAAEDLISSYLILNGYLKYSDVTNTISDTSTNSQIPSAKASYDFVKDTTDDLIVQEITEESSTDKVPSAKAVYDFVGTIDTDTLKNKITNCILKAPNGVLTYYTSTLVAHSGLQVLIPNGRNEDGTLNNLLYNLTDDVTYTYTGSVEIPNDIVFIKSDDTIIRLQDSYVFVVDTYSDLSNHTGSSQYRIAYVKDYNKWYYTEDTGFTWVEYLIAVIGQASVNSNNSIETIISRNTTKLLIEGDLDKINTDLDKINTDLDKINTDLESKADVDLSNCTKPYIVESYKNGYSWYNLYSNGYCEQGGVELGTTSGSLTITLLKPYVDTQYSIIGSDYFGEGVDSITGVDIIGFDSVTTTSFRILASTDADTAAIVNCSWVARGYIE